MTKTLTAGRGSSVGSESAWYADGRDSILTFGNILSRSLVMK